MMENLPAKTAVAIDSMEKVLYIILNESGGFLR